MVLRCALAFGAIAVGLLAATATSAFAASPEILGESASGVTPTTAHLEGFASPNEQTTTCKFEYGTSTASGTTVPCEPEIIDGGEQFVGANLTGLTPGTVYHFRVVLENTSAEKTEGGNTEFATNATGTTRGAVQTFQALAAPLASTGSASGMTRTTATVAGTATPQGLPTTYQILYIPQAAYEAAVAEGAPNPYAAGRVTPAASVLNEARETASDYTSHPVQALLEELEPNTTYHYAVLASNELGSTRGSDATFTTSAPTPPVASTGGAEGVSQLSATLTGSADTQGLPTVVRFEFGTAPGAGTLLAAAITSTSGTSETVTAPLSGVLAPNTTYYYRLIATSQDGTSYGAEQSFTTSGFPAPPFNVPTSNIPLLHYATIGELDAREAKENHGPGPHHRHGRHKQKLAGALRACHKDKAKSKRATCEHRAKRRYGG